jgi:3',5'-cyclic AMP phosphodiesterase CpdA
VTYLRTNLTPVLSKLGVDLVLNGHDHDYARSYLMEGTSIVPGSNGSTVKAADGQTLYITTNSASGGKFYPLTGPYPWTAKTNQENVANYTNVEVNGGKIVVTTYRSTDNSVIDAVTLKNQSV